MTSRGVTPHVEHPCRRLVIALPLSYPDTVERYEQLVPLADVPAFLSAPSWQAAVALAERSAPHGFLRYHQIDVSALMADSGAPGKAMQYLTGNHTIAARMFRVNPAVMLHAPLRTLLFADADGRTSLAVDQPSLLFDSYHDDEISSVGTELDQLLCGLITALGGVVPAELSESL
ncbi:DUF302 domain-containing protein [Mycolicibacterium sp. 018/SC-01/001]|uniref:DUF302 domain-containing protein n=1 Tax=Mycolicibacterium sp. 018/SC-01/001 TaxID=2592069 RepID=UPI001181753D|nr:DUF302 domain-containing protein [Mycolicibacterium sp. 018/SC-01/001]TRW89160.1 DUF302 domain-containing protein [Mycolicibacterium sp. 018/SC-01/001]